MDWKIGYSPERINPGDRVHTLTSIKEMIAAGKAPKKSVVVVLGLTFKENCPDTRNSKVVDIINRLKEYNILTVVCDPWADAEIAKQEYM